MFSGEISEQNVKHGKKSCPFSPPLYERKKICYTASVFPFDGKKEEIMYRYSQQVRQNMANYRLRNTIIAVILVLSLAGCIFFGSMYGSAATYRSRSRDQITYRVMSDLTNARSLAERLTSSVQSNTPIQLAQIRQYVYSMDQMNSLAIQLDGESGRIVPADAISALYEDIDAYFTTIQTNTTSILEIRTLLINHLNALQLVLMNL